MKNFMSNQQFAFNEEDWKAVLIRYGDRVGDEEGLTIKSFRKILAEQIRERSRSPAMGAGRLGPLGQPQLHKELLNKYNQLGRYVPG